MPTEVLVLVAAVVMLTEYVNRRRILKETIIEPINNRGDILINCQILEVYQYEEGAVCSVSQVRVYMECKDKSILEDGGQGFKNSI